MGTIATVPIIDHGIIIGLPTSERKMVYECWNKGKIDISPITHADIRYTLKYIDKQVFGANALYNTYGDFQPPFAHFSKSLGFEWVEKNIDKFDEFGKLQFTDKKSYTLPPYLRDKFRFKKYFKFYSDSTKKYAKEHNISLEEAYIKRQKQVELSLQRKELKSSGTIYNVDKIERLLCQYEFESK